MRRTHEFVAVAILELMLGVFSLTVISMVVEMAWCLFPDERADVYGLVGSLVLWVHANQKMTQIVLLLGQALRGVAFYLSRNRPHSVRWPIWGTWYVAQLVAAIALFFAAVYTVVTGTLPSQ